ncbi:Ferredoxin--NAD(P)(+) reductase (Naphthalene dioxygenase ferredoxin-specific) [Crenothrix polyspora]|uniref:Ferredoxin--NAD(P)(+) reductase (Naphthalene dioxygenase ferredoxin-specific) n=1 Tax=Crenothrix polyspora TaxID=360316 RepID=A0A1R4H336_9GAMM|nr:FAD-binding oxidoreductase [Crenothrix polyspora]SJM90642.1 Ferredoxin--NAD(P)(+) reductase (Naphthalene dioxygenase ferredoxin-specific) [Crenothrix polyspora]
MFTLTIDENSYTCQPGETVLDTLLRENINLSYACKKGTCHSCMVRSPDVMPPQTSQTGLKNTLKTQHYFLACQCYPEQDMCIKLSDQSDFYRMGTVIDNKLLNRNTILLVIAFEDAFEFKAGQFINLQRNDGMTRSYSIANIPQQSNTLEFHIRRLPDGKFSAWLHDEISIGDSIAVSEPRGHCFYLPERREQGLLLVGTGTGLAPLAGILTDALAHGHTGPIHLFHGSRDVEDLYRIDEMRQLAKQHLNFHYIPCLSGKQAPEGFAVGRVNEIALSRLPDLKSWRVFLCGHPDMVNQMKKQVFLKGASMADIYADAFLITLH